MSITATIVAFNCIYLDYPLEASIRSALEVVDEVFINEGNSFDETKDLLVSLQEEFGKDVIRFESRDWKHDRGWQQRERNYAIEQAKGEWILIVDADDMIHEDDAPIIKALATTPYLNFIDFKVAHFYGLPKYINTNPSWYSHHVRMGRKTANYKFRNNPGGSCCDISAGKPLQPVHGRQGHDIAYSGIQLWHYGWVRDARVMGIKTKKFDGWYANNKKYFDGYLDEKVPFDYKMDKSMRFLKEFKGTHPKHFNKWWSSRERLLVYSPEDVTSSAADHDPTKETIDRFNR